MNNYHKAVLFGIILGAVWTAAWYLEGFFLTQQSRDPQIVAPSPTGLYLAALFFGLVSAPLAIKLFKIKNNVNSLLIMKVSLFFVCSLLFLYVISKEHANIAFYIVKYLTADPLDHSETISTIRGITTQVITTSAFIVTAITYVLVVLGLSIPKVREDVKQLFLGIGLLGVIFLLLGFSFILFAI